ncbi:polyprenyl synthetase family protein [uncultured Alistipes sp.]|uniref:polyprenyl synthetase family protein n=1 Tax=uncultured Alistipes sp. TaxID=538949 RepID=UPI001F8E2038|nr:polyprenyl synthetase family protein [uncultured Alistipes sp.]HJC27282.1 polyprenyl synthetase family protein [Candidatus Alistipes stercoravium]
MITLEEIRKPVTAELAAFDEFVERQFTAEGELLSDMLRYALSSRGKGIRPLLVILSAAMNASVKGAAGGRRTSLAAMLVEMIHVASLIHDDVIDEADTRRGRPSVNARWQSHKAVILGDYVLAKNMNIGLQSGQFDLVTHVCGSMAALCEGEVLQDECAAERSMTLKTYLEIIHKKTASLLGVAASVGALAVGATRDRVATMRRFGESLGMAFQIQDDILDYTPSAQTGKPACNDLREGKITLPLLAVLEHASEELRADLLGRLARCREDDAAVESLRRTVEEEGGLAAAATAMQGYITRAVEMLADYEESDYRSALVNLCAFIAERDR